MKSRNPDWALRSQLPGIVLSDFTERKTGLAKTEPLSASSRRVRDVILGAPRCLKPVRGIVVPSATSSLKGRRVPLISAETYHKVADLVTMPPIRTCNL